MYSVFPALGWSIFSSGVMKATAPFVRTTVPPTMAELTAFLSDLSGGACGFFCALLLSIFFFCCTFCCTFCFSFCFSSCFWTPNFVAAFACFWTDPLGVAPPAAGLTCIAPRPLPSLYKKNETFAPTPESSASTSSFARYSSPLCIRAAGWMSLCVGAIHPKLPIHFFTVPVSLCGSSFVRSPGAAFPCALPCALPCVLPCPLPCVLPGKVDTVGFLPVAVVFVGRAG
mmetsp:Transcript_4719/g.11869  ORF Transcript_4719/g.11869 Transcript_4719/m.11869 type:complete len:228 (-) Transcript_4719:377-1060(-)